MVLAFAAFHWNKTRSPQIVDKLSNLARQKGNVERSTCLFQPHFEVLLFLTLGQALGAVYDAPLRWPRG